jgi:uncharacterized membrane protein
MDPVEMTVGGVLVAVLVVAVLLIHFAPSFGDRTLFFGVQVDVPFTRTDAARRVLRWYRGINLAVGLAAILAVVFAWLAPLDARRFFDPSLVVVAAVVLHATTAIVIYVVAHRRVLGQVRGTALAAAAEEAERHWKAGLIYFNRDDRRVQVGKRFGGGITLNFARPIAWLIVGIPIFFAVLIIAIVEATH